MVLDTAFEISSSNIRFGVGVTCEVGMDLKDRGLRRVMVLTDQNLNGSMPVERTLESIRREGVEYELFDKVRVEPTDTSLGEAIEFAKEGCFDSFVAVGGGSTIDTAKAANLYSTHPADFLEYVNAPIGLGRPVPGPLKPLIAIPTTAGTGSETTGVAIFDLEHMAAKTGIAHRYLKPTLGIVDPENTRTLPAMVAASTGLDVLSHALESYTAIKFDKRPLPERPQLRPAYQGANSISDVWALEALRLVAEFLPRAVADRNDDTARGKMLLASTMAGMGFGNAGVHLPHGMSYPVAGMIEKFKPKDYLVDYSLVPHGMAVIVSAPAVFRFTYPACPDRHIRAAKMLGAADACSFSSKESGEVLSSKIIELMQKLEMPNGLGGLGFTEKHIPSLVKGTLPQHRVTKLSPVPVDEEQLNNLFLEALRYW